jgi:hypothetical protein
MLFPPEGKLLKPKLMKIQTALLVFVGLTISSKPALAFGHSSFSTDKTKTYSRFALVCPPCDKQLKRASADKKKAEGQPVANEKKIISQ